MAIYLAINIIKTGSLYLLTLYYHGILRKLPLVFQTEFCPSLTVKWSIVFWSPISRSPRLNYLIQIFMHLLSLPSKSFYFKTNPPTSLSIHLLISPISRTKQRCLTGNVENLFIIFVFVLIRWIASVDFDTNLRTAKRKWWKD